MQNATFRIPEDQARNLDPHKPAVVAMLLYNERYAAQKGGSMDFWDSMSDGEKKTCREAVERIERAWDESPEPNKALEEMRDRICAQFDWIWTCFVEGDEIIIEEPYEMTEDEKNDDDCCDVARENGEAVVEAFPVLEISDYYCHRHKYAIVELQLKKPQTDQP